jgi:PBP4 family serine-type D-alanyl-D-alanine carboxypeptidase
MRRVVVVAGILSSIALAQSHVTFDKRFKTIINRPEYRHSRFGLEVYAPDDDKVLYAWHAQELFIPGSTTKILTIGTALELLGADFRFHTKIYRVGPLVNGTLDGDLVLVASGDPNLSNRIQSDGTMVFENEDHSYDGFAAAKAVPGDPLMVIRELAGKAAARGVLRINGRVRVDASLFPEGQRELGTRVVISPMVVNDNLVDVTVTPGSVGDAPSLAMSPQTRYLTIRNEVKTVTAGGATELLWSNDSLKVDGTHMVTLSGTIAAGSRPRLRAYRVPTPSRFAEIVLTEALESAGVRVGGEDRNPARVYTEENEIAEHISPPLREEAKVTLKVSQNLHASMWPYILGATVDKRGPDPLEAGFRREGEMLRKAGLDLDGAVQNDGAGGAALFSPDFMVHFLSHVKRQPFFADFLKSLPVLGRDGTLFDIQTQSPAAGHVHAKTGTFGSGNALTGGGVVDGKGLAGFVDTRDGRRLVFAAYINFVPLPEMNEESTKKVGEALGEIASAVYDGFPGRGRR